MTAPTMTESDAFAVQQFSESVLNAIEPVLQGKREPTRLALTCLLAGGHLLIEDVPGTGKTTLARSLALAIGGGHRRVQFTPDLLPTDITGVSVYDAQRREFEFRPGPVFANIVIADEINRASPKTQSALLEVMEEGQVTVDGVAHLVPQPFLVVATQNPVDLEGTYRLPEAQLDRFLMRISVGYPAADIEEQILTGRAAADVAAVQALLETEHVLWLQRATARVHVDPAVAHYIVLIARMTREHDALRLGMSTRGSLALLRAAQANAATLGRHYVTPDDVRAVLDAVVAHRLVLTAQAEVQGRAAVDVLAEVADAAPLPSTPARSR